jgi:hypothetical protein
MSRSVENDEFCLFYINTQPNTSEKFMHGVNVGNLLIISDRFPDLINKATSSAYICSLSLNLFWKILFTNMLNIVGEAGEPCGRPMFILDVVLTVSPTHTNCVRSLRKDDKKSLSASDTFMSSMSSISKVLERSIYIETAN